MPFERQDQLPASHFVADAVEKRGHHQDASAAGEQYLGVVAETAFEHTGNVEAAALVGDHPVTGLAVIGDSDVHDASAEAWFGRALGQGLRERIVALSLEFGPELA